MEWDLLEVDTKINTESEFVNISEFSKYHYINDKTNINMVLMNYDDFNADLYKSFKYNSRKILTLFKMDVPRETLMINGVEYNKPKKAFKEINKLVKTVKWRKMIYMLCTQAVMYIPCYLLTRTYCNETYYLGETKEHDSMKVDIKMDGEKNNSVNINKVLRIFYVDDDGDKTVSKISFNIHVEFDKCVILAWNIN